MEFIKNYLIIIVILLSIIFLSGCEYKSQDNTNLPSSQAKLNKESQDIDFKSLIDKKNNLDFHIKYSAIITGDYEGQGTYDLYQKTSKRIRTDTTILGSTSTQIYDNGKGEKPQQQMVEDDYQKFTIEFKEKRKYLDEDTYCFSIKGTLGMGSIEEEYCYNNNGIPLYQKSSDSFGSTEMTPISYELKVDDSTFLRDMK